MADPKKLSQTSMRELWGVVLATLGVLSLLALASYDPGDISYIKYPPNAPPTNYIGPVGAWFTFIMLTVLGLGVVLVPVWFFLMGAFLLFRPDSGIRSKGIWAVLAMVISSCIIQLHPSWFELLSEKANIQKMPGGMMGLFLAEKGLSALLGHTGANVLIAGLLAACLLMLVGMSSIIRFLRGTGLIFVVLKNRIEARIDARRDRIERIAREERDLRKQRAKVEKNLAGKKVANEKPLEPKQTVPVPDVDSEPDSESGATPGEVAGAVNIPIVSGTRVAAEETGEAPYQLPPLSLLNDPPAGEDREIKSDFETTSRILRETLAEFGVACEITNVVQGPVVTRFELLPAAGVRVERIAGLSNNLALSLKATSVRVQAPIPGKGVVGVEVPNTLSSKVYIKDIINSDEWQGGVAALPLILGKDVSGKAIIADLARMPHLLIAGATGSGKTVCMNSVLTGLLMTRTPAQMRMMLVDPKIVEFSVYNALPHLIVPVITDPKKVILGLRWAINEMESRYKLFAKVGVRNIEGFNERRNAEGRRIDDSEEDYGPDELPYIVIIIDELADLMMAAKVDVEYAITRLAQLSRAVGIHMIIATQRPSVNVITGTIKANFPARISFQVAQMTDSRTILDAKGAEKLLGRGDMLFMPPGSIKLVRAQGAMTTDEETRNVVKFIKDQAAPVYEVAIKESIESGSSASQQPMPDEDDQDEELLEMAVTIIRESRRASTSSLQRRLRIGYNRAARLMDLLEERGVIGPPRGSEPREILVDLDVDAGLGDETEQEET